MKPLPLLACLIASPAWAQCPPIALSPADAQPGEQLGRSAAIEGDTAVLGAWKYDRPGTSLFGENGAGVVFERQAGAWSAVARLFHVPAGGPFEQDWNAHAGHVVAISGTRVVVGAPGYRVTQNTDGAVFSWVRTGSGWIEEPLLRGIGENTYEFGRALAVQGDEVLVGDPPGRAPFPSAVFFPGRIWRFTRSATGWNFAGYMWASDVTAYARFAESMAIDGDRLIVGATLADGPIADCGAAYVFERSGSNWVQTARLVASTPAAGDEFGASVALRGDVAVVGARLADAPGGLADAGAVHVYRLVNGAWTPTSLAYGERAGAQLGCSVAISATKVLAGARRDTLAALDAGSAALWDLVGGSLANRRTLVSPDASNYDQFGISVALSEDSALVGAFSEGFNGGDLLQIGAGYVFADGGTDADADQVPDACEAHVGTALCFGDGSGSACPCGNASAPSERAGCLNSFGRGGALTAEGVASVAADSIVLTAAWLPANVPVLFYQGDGSIGGGAGTAFGDGLRCAGGATVRLGKPFADASGVARFGAGVAGTNLVSIAGAIPGTGGTRVYQVWYRNAAVFCSASTFNLTSGLRLIWAP